VAAVALREERLAWTVLGLGILSYAAGDFVLSWGYAGPPPFPSAADAFWLSFYPAAALTLWLLVRSRLPSVRSGLWLDGAIGAVAAMALASALLYGPIFHANAGAASAAVLTNLAYPRPTWCCSDWSSR
jgi:hypothetical protein